VADVQETKQCGVCGETKPIDDFYRQSTKPESYLYERRLGRCKPCVSKRNNENRKKNLDGTNEMYRRWAFKKKFDITVEDYDRLLETQRGLCAICRGPQRGRGKYFAVDHCHTTGRVRGLLCGPCNRGIGFLGDDPGRVSAAIAYLETVAR
jgi:hypothetical protein